MTSLISNTNNTTPKKSKRSRTKSKSIKKRWYEPTWYTIHSKQNERHQQQQKQQQQQQHHQNTTTNNRRIDLTSLPRLDEVHTSQIDQLLHLKLLGCCENISFQIDSKDIKHKRSTKRNTLLELVEYVTSNDENRLRFFSSKAITDGFNENKQLCSGGHLRIFIEMVSCNLFCPHNTRADGERGGILIDSEAIAIATNTITSTTTDSVDEAKAVRKGMTSSNSSKKSKRRNSGSSSTSNSSVTDVVHNAAWSHIQIIYEFFIRFIFDDTINTKDSRLYINRAFLHGLLEQFRSSDVRERGYVKTIIHQCYTKFHSLRTFIRGTMKYMLLEYITSNITYYHGIITILEIFASIIAGFKSPMRNEHRVLLQRVLMPLHRSGGMGDMESFEMLHGSLLECVVSFVQRDITTLDIVIKGLLNAFICSPNVLLLDELEICINLSPPK